MKSVKNGGFVASWMLWTCLDQFSSCWG